MSAPGPPAAAYRHKSVLSRPRVRERVIAWVLEGKSAAYIGALAAPGEPVSAQAVSQWRKRNADVIEEARARAEGLVLDVAIRDKVERVRRLAGLYDGMQDIVTTRGLMASEPKWIGSDKVGREVELQRFDAALVKEMRGTLRDVAEELGQVPRPDVSVQQTLVLIRQVIGVDPDVPLG
mgnify:CR=1 FL=1